VKVKSPNIKYKEKVRYGITSALDLKTEIILIILNEMKIFLQSINLKKSLIY